jgi:hypothetical protein
MDNITSVPRDGESKGGLFGISGEVNQNFGKVSTAFYGFGSLLNNTYSELYVHSGLWQNKFNVYKEIFGLKYSLTTRLGILYPHKEYFFFGDNYFSKLSIVNNTSQIEGGIFVNIFNITIELSWMASYSTGAFLANKTNKPFGMFLEGIKTKIWKFSFERYNDSLNGTDYGPSYGIKINLII